MDASQAFQAIRTLPERCRVCYTCVRECPAKAIRIVEGQARVIHERCIACGNCVRVCSQRAKKIADSMPAVRALLEGDAPVAAIVAPSFPAAFEGMECGRLVAMIRALGFAWVNEVAFGADLVARAYRNLLETSGKSYIATSCPAVVSYVEKYCPDLVNALAPIVSPMVATARCLRQDRGKDLRVVFIGPCTAKKAECADELLRGDVDAVLTFIELRAMFAAAGLEPAMVHPTEFDRPHGGAGALFPLSGGLLQAADVREDLLEENVVVADGRDFVEAIREYERGHMETQLLEVLACDGCIMGAGMGIDAPLFHRRSLVSRHAREQFGLESSRKVVERFRRYAGVSLRRGYEPRDQRLPAPHSDRIAEILQRMGKFKPEDELNCGACGYETCREHAVAILKGLAESEMCLPYTIDRLNVTVRELASTQEALGRSERLAGMGQLAAGIAHEVNNPLGVVLMYAHMLLEDCPPNSPMRADLSLVAEEADRCKRIISGLLNFARRNKVVPRPVDVCEVVDGALKVLALPATVALRLDHAMDDPRAELDRDQFVQVLTNLCVNALAAMPDGGVMTVRTEGDGETVRVIVSDTGVGIPPANLDKVFEPFFTTKQIGKGTGLGLAVTYGIVKMHRGDITVASRADPAAGPTGTTFTVTLPRFSGRRIAPPDRKGSGGGAGETHAAASSPDLR